MYITKCQVYIIMVASLLFSHTVCTYNYCIPILFLSVVSKRHVAISSYKNSVTFKCDVISQSNSFFSECLLLFEVSSREGCFLSSSTWTTSRSIPHRVSRSRTNNLSLPSRLPCCDGEVCSVVRRGGSTSDVTCWRSLLIDLACCCGWDSLVMAEVTDDTVIICCLSLELLFRPSDGACLRSAFSLELLSPTVAFWTNCVVVLFSCLVKFVFIKFFTTVLWFLGHGEPGVSLLLLFRDGFVVSATEFPEICTVFTFNTCTFDSVVTVKLVSWRIRVSSLWLLKVMMLVAPISVTADEAFCPFLLLLLSLGDGHVWPHSHIPEKFELSWGSPVFVKNIYDIEWLPVHYTWWWWWWFIHVLLIRLMQVQAKVTPYCAHAGIEGR